MDRFKFMLKGFSIAISITFFAVLAMCGFVFILLGVKEVFEMLPGPRVVKFPIAMFAGGVIFFLLGGGIKILKRICDMEP